MPRVTLKSGLVAADGRDDELSEYLCDSPDCPNIATHVLGCVKELAALLVVCEQHAPQTHPRPVRASNADSDRGSAG
jgi:hypothetical protein